MSDRRNLLLRVISAAVLAPLTIAVAYYGGWPFVLFWMAAALAVWWEWLRLVDRNTYRGVLLTGAAVIGIEAAMVVIGHVEIAVPIAALGAIAVAVIAGKNTRWIAAGLLYASVLLLAPVIVRQTDDGFAAMIFLFAAVWMSDIAGYFIGRAIGGPKLAPSISPKKTVSGALGGLIGAVVAGLAVFSYTSGDLATAAGLAVALSIAAQIGDLLESKIKRLFDAKDSSELIPGHGGVMDRLDGFNAAAFLFALILLSRSDLSLPRGTLIPW